MNSEEIKRFWKKVNKTNTCWFWTATKRNGYGRFWSRNRLVSAHHFSWELVNGPIPEWQELHHKCHNESCVNPDHLELQTELTHPGNGADVNRNKTHCPRGHEYSVINTRYYVTNSGNGIGRACRLCDSDRISR